MTRDQRHYCMSRIRGKDTRPEMVVRRYLHAQGFRYSIHVRRLPGCPDIVLRKYHTVIFVNGCFWHGHPGCGKFRMPSSNVEFWQEKIRRNKERDAQEVAALEELGWKVIVVWECGLSKTVREDTLRNLADEIRRSLEPESIHTIPLAVRKLSMKEDDKDGDTPGF